MPIVPPSSDAAMDRCKVEESRRKGAFKNIAARKLGLCSGLAAADFMSMFVPGLQETVIKKISNITNISKILGIENKLEKGLQLEREEESIINSLREAERLENTLGQTAISSMEGPDRINKIQNTLGKVSDNPVAKFVKHNTIGQSLIGAQIESGNFEIDCIINNYQLLNSDKDNSCNNGYLRGKQLYFDESSPNNPEFKTMDMVTDIVDPEGIGTCAPCKQIFGQHEPRNARDESYSGTRPEGEVDINRDNFTQLYCGYEDMSGYEDHSWALRVPPKGICVIKNLYNDPDSRHTGSDTNLSSPFFVSNEFECQSLGFQLSDNNATLTMGESLRDPQEEHNWLLAQKNNNYQYYPLDNDLNLVQDPSPPPGLSPPNVISNILNAKYPDNPSELKDVLLKSASNEYHLHRNTIDYIENHPSLSYPGFGVAEADYIYNNRDNIGNWWDSFNIDSIINWGTGGEWCPGSLFRSGATRCSDLSYEDLFSQKYNNQNVCNSDNFILSGTSISLQDSADGDQHGFNPSTEMCGVKTKTPNHCCPKLVNGENCPIFQDDLTISRDGDLMSPGNLPVMMQPDETSQPEVPVPKWKTNWNQDLNKLSSSNCYSIQMSDIENNGYNFIDSEGGIECDNQEGNTKIVERNLNLGRDNIPYSFIDVDRPDVDGVDINLAIKELSANEDVYSHNWYPSHVIEDALVASGAIEQSERRNDGDEKERTNLKSLDLNLQPLGSYWGTRAIIDNKLHFTKESDSGATGYEHYIDPFDIIKLKDYTNEIPAEEKLVYDINNRRGVKDSGSQNSQQYIDHYNNQSEYIKSCQTCWSFKKATKNDIIGDSVYARKTNNQNYHKLAGKGFTNYSKLDLLPKNKDEVIAPLKGCEGEFGKCSDLEKTQYVQQIYDNTFCKKYNDNTATGKSSDIIINKFYRPVGISLDGLSEDISDMDKKKYSDICCGNIENSAYSAFIGCDSRGDNSYFIDDIIKEPNETTMPNYENLKITKTRDRIKHNNKNFNQCNKAIPRSCFAVQQIPETDESTYNTESMDCNYKLRNFYTQYINELKEEDLSKFNAFPMTDNILKQVCETDFQSSSLNLPQEMNSIPGSNCTYANPSKLKAGFLGYVPHKKNNAFEDWNSSPNQPPHQFELNPPSNSIGDISSVYNECILIPDNYNILDIEIHDKNIDWASGQEGEQTPGNIRYIGSSPPSNIYDKITVKCFDEFDNPISAGSPIQDHSNENIHYYNVSCSPINQTDNRELLTGNQKNKGYIGNIFVTMSIAIFGYIIMIKEWILQLFSKL